MHPGKDLYVSGEAPTLDLEGRVESGTLRIGRSGDFLMKSKDFTANAIQLEDQAVLNVLVPEDGDPQSVRFSNLTLGYGVVLNFTQPNVTLTADSLEMLPASVIKVSAETAQLHVIADSVTIHDNAEISVTGQGLADLSTASAGEMCVCGVGGGCLCVCVRACVRVRVCVCVRACVHLCTCVRVSACVRACQFVAVLFLSLVALLSFCTQRSNKERKLSTLKIKREKQKVSFINILIKNFFFFKSAVQMAFSNSHFSDFSLPFQINFTC